jgi:hypothetical protein
MVLESVLNQCGIGMLFRCSNDLLDFGFEKVVVTIQQKNYVARICFKRFTGRIDLIPNMTFPKIRSRDDLLDISV